MQSNIGLLVISLLFSILIIVESKISFGFYQQVSDTLNQIDFSKAILEVMLCFLLFSGSLHVEMVELRKARYPVFAFSTLGVILSTFLFGTLIYFIINELGYQMEYIYCLLFGALISPTDPIAVLSIIKGKVPSSIETTISGESLFNDGIGVVIFLTISQIIETGINNLDAWQVVLLFGQEVIGGLVVGIIMGNLVYFLIRKIDHYQTEVLLSISMVMIINELSHFYNISSPLAVVTAGLLMGNHVTLKVMSATTKDYLLKFWELIDGFLNSFLFVLIGLQLVVIPFSAENVLIGIISIPILLFCRWISIMIPTQFIKNKELYNRKSALLLTWGGLRGGLSIAMALSLPNSSYKNIIVAASYVIVIFSIIVQGLTTDKLAKSLFK